jgi:hypothetical protein
MLELLGLLHQRVLLLAPELLLQPSLQAQTLQLELPPQQCPLLVLLQLWGCQFEPGQLSIPFSSLIPGQDNSISPGQGGKLGSACW